MLVGRLKWSKKIYAKWRNLDENKLGLEKKADYDTDFIKSKELGKQLDSIYADLEEFIMDRASFSVRPLQSSTNENTVPLVFSQEDPFHFSTLSPSGETLNTVPVSLSRIYVYDIKSPLSKNSLQQNKNDVNPSNRYSLKRGENLKRDKNFRNFSNAVDKALMSTIDWDSIYEKYTDGIFDIFVNKNAIYGILNQYKDDIAELAKLRDAKNVLNIDIEQEIINKMADSLFTSLVYDPNTDAKYVLPELKRVKSAMDRYNNKKGGIHIGDIEWSELKYKLDTRNKRTRRGTLTANNIALQWKKDGGSE